MRLEHVMTREAVKVHEQDKIVDAACRMRDQAASSVLVVDDAGALVGILTERDLAHKVVAAGRSAETLVVADCMTLNPVTAGPRDRVWEGARLMSEHQIRHLPVIRDGLPIGMVSSDDIAGMETEPRATRDVIRGIEESSREMTMEIPTAVGAGELADIIPAWY